MAGRTDGGRKRILVVDDDVDIRESLSELLSETYDISEASNGELALEKLSQGHFDGVLLDLMMPVLDGLGVLEQLRQRGSAVPVILNSAAPLLATLVSSHGASDWLQKPFDIDVLEQKLARVLAAKP